MVVGSLAQQEAGGDLNADAHPAECCWPSFHLRHLSPWHPHSLPHWMVIKRKKKDRSETALLIPGRCVALSLVLQSPADHLALPGETNLSSPWGERKLGAGPAFFVAG